jgi:hypothetical protein
LVFGGFSNGKGRNYNGAYVKYINELNYKIDKLRYADIFNDDALKIIKRNDYNRAFLLFRSAISNK